MTSRVAKITTCAAALLAIAAIAVPSALASPTGLPLTPQTQGHEGQLPVHSLGIGGHDLSFPFVSFQATGASDPSGFAWSAAGFGAFAAAVACVMAMGLVLNPRVRKNSTRSDNRPEGGQP
jgi:hypothetical protein